jgi:glycosyltransferase involved in cell wall biosynthesis
MVVTPGNQSSDQDRVIIVDKAFLKPTSDKLRGVELFNLHLVRELMALGYKVTFVSLRSWQSRIFSVLESNKPDFLWVPNLGNAAISALLVPWLLRDQQHDTLLIGNVGKGLIPLIRKLTKPGRFKKTVCIAHRESCDRFAQLCADIDCTVVAVSGGIARSFDGANCSRVAVDYGIMNADQFHPPAQETTASDEKINFCVLGMLDNAWKGSDTAVAAFRALPAAVRNRYQLHLASFSSPPDYPEDGITVYPWMPHEKIAELLQSMDVMIVPSRDEHVMRETFSQAMVQGMLCGLPLLTNDLPVLTEKLDNGGGLIFHDVEELARQMVQLADDAPLRKRLGAEGRATALERYVWNTERFAARYLT